MSAGLRWDLTTRDVQGIGRVGFVLPVLSEDLPPDLREAVIRRRLAVLGDGCPCGARAVLPNRDARRRAAQEHRQLAMTVIHEHDCPASDDRIVALAGKLR